MTILEFAQLFASVTGKSETEVIAALKKNAEGDELKGKTEIESYLKGLIVSKIQSVSSDQQKRGRKEALEGLEREIKTEFGFQSNAIGKDLIKELVTAQVAAAKPTSGQPDGEWTREKLSALPIVQELITEGKQEAGTKYSDLQAEYNNFKQTQQTQQLKSLARQHGIDALDKHKAILGEKEDRKRRLDFFFDALPYDNLKLVEKDGKPQIVVLDSNGHTQQDDFGNPISYEQFVKQRNPYGFHKYDPNQNSPSPQPGGGSPSGGGTPMNFKSDAEFYAYLSDPKISRENKEMVMKTRQQKK